ncbi:MAG: FAD-dependent oxidoreductase [Phycisphaerae bacterium]
MVESLPGLHYYRPVARQAKPETYTADVIIYGASSAGITAAMQVRNLGHTVIVVELGTHIGGLTSGGLGATDIGNKNAIGGISYQFYQDMGTHYGQSEAWNFEPKAASAWFHKQCETFGITVHTLAPLTAVRKTGTTITEIETATGAVYRGKMFIDASYEGDLMAKAGVSYHVGREANSQYRETLNGVHFGNPGHNFRAWVDPYITPGQPSSGLLPGVQDVAPGFQGQGDHCVQAYNFRACLSFNPANRKPIPKPAGYNPMRYELLRRYIAAGIYDPYTLSRIMPNQKTDTNNYGAFSSDNIGMNYQWPDGTYETREQIFQDHVNYQMGIYYFLCTDERLPQWVRDDAQRLGLPLDEFTNSGGWTPQLYIREARRMIGGLVMTEYHCRGTTVVEDPIALAAYTMDSHNCRRLVVDGRVINEGNVEIGGFPPYPISIRSLTPQAHECTNLVVPVCLSASHIAYGSIRMEPVFMITGQSAGTIAVQALSDGVAVQALPYAQVRAQQERDGIVLEWTSDQASKVRPVVESDSGDLFYKKYPLVVGK